MILGLGLGLSKKNKPSGGGGSKNYTPTANTATNNVNGISFNANATLGSDNVALFLDVANDSGFTDTLSAYNGLNIGLAVPYTVNNGISALHTYYYRFRAALNVVVIPTLRTSWDVVISVPFTGSGTDISDALAAITDASPTKWYKIVLQSGVTYTENAIQCKNYVDVEIPSTTTVSSTVTGFFQDIFLMGGITCMLFGGGTIEHIGNNYAIHLDASVPCIGIISGLTCKSTGAGAKNGIGLGIYGNQHYYILNCICESDAADGILAHNQTSSTDSMQLYIVDTTCITPAGYGVAYANEGNASTTDFVYVKGGNVGVFLAQGASNETYYYIDPSTITTSITVPSPSKLLNASQFASFLATNYLSMTGNSNVVSVTTVSEGTRPLDNKTSGTIQFAVSAGYQLRSNYGGGLISTTTNAAPVNTWNDQSLNGNDVTASSNQPVYSTNGFASGVPSILSITGGSPSQLSLPSTLNMGISYDLIAVVNRAGGLAIFDTNNVPKLYVDATTFRHFTNNSGVGTLSGQSITLGSPVLVRIKRRGTVTVEFYQNQALLGSVSLMNNNLTVTWQYLLNGITGDNTNAFVAECALLTNMPDSEVDAYITSCITRYNL